MPWFKVDDKLHDHRKARTAKKSAIGVWVLAGSWSMDNLTDGFIPESVLSRWGTKADAATLVRVGLWHVAEKDGEPGWQFHDWDEFQPKAVDILAEREQARDRMKRIRAGRRSGERSGELQAKFERSSVTPSPVPSRPLSVVTTSSQSPSALDALTDEDWQKIQGATRGPLGHARKVADDVLSKSSGDVTSPRRYILRAIKNEPELYRYHRGNPKRGEDCSTHPGQWADSCAGCAADRKAGA